MSKIIRTPTQVKGGITPDEAAKLKAHADLWTRRIMRTEPIDRSRIVPAIERLYQAAGKRKPRVVVVPSPLVANLAGGLSAAIWHLRKRAATDAATDAKHWLRRLVEKFTPNAIEFSLGVIKISWRIRQGGNHWGQFDSYLTACRDILGLTGLSCWEKYAAWEECAIEGSWRIMHEEFCIVSDFLSSSA